MTLPPLVISIAVASSIGALISAHWQALGYLASHDKSLFLPLALQSLGGAVALGLLPLLFERRLPNISIKSSAASVAIAVLLYGMGGTCFFVALRVLPAPLVVLVFATI